jgi:hypothetical protein
MAKRKLTDGYIIQLLRQNSSLSVDDIRDHPNLIDAKREHIRFIRLTRKMEEETDKKE